LGCPSNWFKCFLVAIIFRKRKITNHRKGIRLAKGTLPNARTQNTCPPIPPRSPPLGVGGLRWQRHLLHFVRHFAAESACETLPQSKTGNLSRLPVLFCIVKVIWWIRLSNPLPNITLNFERSFAVKQSRPREKELKCTEMVASGLDLNITLS